MVVYPNADSAGGYLVVLLGDHDHKTQKTKIHIEDMRNYKDMVNDLTKIQVEIGIKYMRMEGTGGTNRGQGHREEEYDTIIENMCLRRRQENTHTRCIKPTTSVALRRK